MNTSAKLHAIKHFILYAFKSKTKYKVHSPFVFNFINDVLEFKGRNLPKFPSTLINYYTKDKKDLSIAENAGAGSHILKQTPVEIKTFVSKIGMPKKYGKILYQICEKYQCKEIIELGTSLGISTSYIAAATNTKVQSIDANQQIQAITKAAFAQLGKDNVDFINARFDDCLESICKNTKDISLIFIDGDHNKEATIRYFNTCLPYLNENSIIIFDDIYWSKGMTEAWNHICEHEAVKLSIDLYRIGIIFFRKEQKEKEHFTLWY